MPRLYVARNNNYVSYKLDGGGSGDQLLPPHVSKLEAEYIAIMYGLNEYFLSWNKELDSRWSNVDPETKNIVNVIEASAQTKRPLPPPVLLCLSNEKVLLHISMQKMAPTPRIAKRCREVWQMTSNIDIKYLLVPKSDNLAFKGD